MDAPFKIGKSHAGAFPDFNAAVTAFADEMNAWRAHMGRVGADPEQYQPYPRPQAHPIIVQAVAAVEGPGGGVETYQPNFEIVDDGPPPEQIAQAKKAALAGQIAQAERDAISNVFPSRKLRLLNLRIGEVRKRDTVRHDEIAGKHHDEIADFHARRDEAVKQNQKRMLELFATLATVKTAEDAKKVDVKAEIEKVSCACDETLQELGDAPRIDIVGESHKARPKDDQRLLDLADTIQRDIRAIELHAAELLDELEDVPPDALDSWVMRPFPEPTRA